MTVMIMTVIFALGLAVLFAWAFRHLPQERWQMLAAMPGRPQADGTWTGINLTYYGFFNALAVALGLATATYLLGAVRVPFKAVAVAVSALLVVVLPASKIVNRLVEGHAYGFTVGGACFVGLIAGPWLVRGALHLTLPPAQIMSATTCVLGAVAVAYALGEGIGRLACISFGCCYGQPLERSPALLRRLFARAAFVFEGRLKKASYERGYGHLPLIPVQGITAVVSSLAGLAGFALFLQSRPLAAFVEALIVTQSWRFFSEFFRADYRGPGRISAYQWMALVATAYTAWLALRWPAVSNPTPDLSRGWALLGRSETILLIEAAAFVVFWRMGRSTVTASRIVFHLRDDHGNFVPVGGSNDGLARGHLPRGVFRMQKPHFSQGKWRASTGAGRVGVALANTGVATTGPSPETVYPPWGNPWPTACRCNTGTWRVGRRSGSGGEAPGRPVPARYP